MFTCDLIIQHIINTYLHYKLIWKLLEFPQSTISCYLNQITLSIPCFIKPMHKCFQLNRLLVQSMRNYIMSLDWTSAIRAADLCSIFFSSSVNGCFTMWVTPFSPKTQGSDRKTSLSMPCWPCKVKTNNPTSETMDNFSLPFLVLI